MLSLGINTSAKATLIAYEGFNYAHGLSITQQNGGIGWGSAWGRNPAQQATVYNGSLTYNNGGSLLVSGGFLRGSADPGEPYAQPVIVERSLLNANLLSVYGSTIWISFLAQNYNTSTEGVEGFRQTKFSLLNVSTINNNIIFSRETLAVGTPNTYVAGASDHYTLWITNNGSQYVSTGIATDRSGMEPGQTAATMFLLRLDLDGTTAADTASLWINPVIGNGSALTLGAAHGIFSLIDLDSVNAFRFSAAGGINGHSNAIWNVDELRIGTTYLDVTPVPEPSTVILLGIAVSGLWLAHRRKPSPVSRQP